MNQYQSGKRNKLKMFTLEIKIILKQVFETLFYCDDRFMSHRFD